jgi:hypothetical protein
VAEYGFDLIFLFVLNIGISVVCRVGLFFFELAEILDVVYVIRDLAASA